MVEGIGMLVGYVRVSKAGGSQATDLQRDTLRAAGVNARHIYEDTASGKRDDRPGLAACLKALREKDTLVVWKLDRLGRDLRHLVNTVHEPVAAASASGADRARDDDRHDDGGFGKLVFDFRALAESEPRADRRANEGRASARARGPVKRPSVQVDRRQAQAGDGGDGEAGDSGGRAVRGAGDQPADSLPPLFPASCLTIRWPKAAGAIGA